jgi:hypothetical protein
MQIYLEIVVLSQMYPYSIAKVLEKQRRKSVSVRGNIKK